MEKTKKYTSILLCICASLSLCACAATEKDSNELRLQQPVQPETEYRAEYYTLVSGEHHLGARALAEDGYYALDYAVEPSQSEDSGDEYVSAIYFVSYSGGVERLRNYRPVSAPEEYASLPNFYSSHELLGLCCEDDGSLIALESLYMSWYAGEGERLAQYGSYYDDHRRAIYIRRLDKSGKELECVPLQLEDDENIFVSQLVMDAKERLVLCRQNSLIFCSLSGEKEAELELGGYVRCLLQSSSGELAALCYTGDAEESLYFISRDNPEILRSVSVPSGMMHFSLCGGVYDAGYTDGLNFFGYDFESGESVQLFDWISCGVDVNCLSALRFAPDGSVEAVSNTYNSYKDEYITEHISIKKGAVPENRILLRLGSVYPDDELVGALLSFNRTNEGCRIELVDYSRLYDFGSAGGQGRLMKELLSGNIPDILDLEGLNFRLLASKGLLEDLYPWLDGDTELDREDFFPNLLAACEHEGRLFAASPGFCVDTVLASSSLTGDKPSWSYEEYYAALAAMGEDCSAFEVFITSEDILRSVISAELDSYVNWNELKSDFENESFISLLDFAGSFPSSFDWSGYEWTDADIVENRLAQGRQMLLRTSLFGIDEIYYNSIYFEGSPSYKGYPTYDGSSGNVLDADMGFGISAHCANKDMAWRFIRGFLTEDAQQSRWGFPANREIFLRKLDKAMSASYLTDENGQLVLNEEGQPIELSQGNMGTVLGVRGMYSLSPAQARQLTELLDGCTKLKTGDSELVELIVDKARLYFDAQRGAKATAALVEDAVNAYLSQYR